MAEHAEETANDQAAGTTRAPRRPAVDWRRGRDTAAGLIAGIIRWAGLIFAAILVIDVIFVVASANPDNGIVSWIRGWADTLAIGFRDLFEPSDAKLRVLVNYGSAALFWLIVSSILSRLVRRVTGGTV